MLRKVLMAVLIAIGIIHLSLEPSEKEIKYKQYVSLKAACSQATQGSMKGKVSQSNSRNICGCFATTILNYPSGSVTEKMENQELVNSIMETCEGKNGDMIAL